MTEFIAFHEHIEEGWLGDPKEWPVLFLRDHVVRERWQDILFRLEDVPPGDSWINHTSHSTAYVYMEVQDNGEEDLEFHLLSALPDVGRREGHATWLEFEIDNDEVQLWETTFGAYSKGGPSMTPVADWTMRHGLCPGQWFVVKLRPNYSESYDSWSGGYECDFECSAEILDHEKLPLPEHERRWLEFLTRKDLEDGLPRLAEQSITGTAAVSLTWVCAKSERGKQNERTLGE